MRWWKELRNPALKCERLGHDIRPVEFEGYCLPSEVSGVEGVMGRLNGAVAFDISVTFHVCSRCKFEEKDKKEIKVNHSIQSLSMPSDDWRKLEQDGYFLRRV